MNPIKAIARFARSLIRESKTRSYSVGREPLTPTSPIMRERIINTPGAFGSVNRPNKPNRKHKGVIPATCCKAHGYQ